MDLAITSNHRSMASIATNAFNNTCDAIACACVYDVGRCNPGAWHSFIDMKLHASKKFVWFFSLQSFKLERYPLFDGGCANVIFEWSKPVLQVLPFPYGFILHFSDDSSQQRCVCHLFDFNANVKIWNEQEEQRNGKTNEKKTNSTKL